MSETYDRIYAVIRKIPHGKVATYGQVALLAGLGPHARMVGYALHALRNGTDLPWFRVVGAGGKLSLPGEGGRMQAGLLEREGVELAENGKIPMDRIQLAESSHRQPPDRQTDDEALFY